MNGLILAGGASSRMGQDKALLNFHGKAQWQAVYELLLPFCEKIFFNTNTIAVATLPIIKDNEKYTNSGPLAGLLSAYEMEPNNYLVLAIDYPFITKQDVQELLAAHNKKETAILYNIYTEFYEPYLGIYTSAFIENIISNYTKDFSMQKYLKDKAVTKVAPINLVHLQNVNTMAQYKEIKKPSNKIE